MVRLRSVRFITKEENEIQNACQYHRSKESSWKGVSWLKGTLACVIEMRANNLISLVLAPALVGPREVR